MFKFFSPYQALHLFSTGVLSEIFLTPCSIHSIVPEAVCCDFIKYLLILSSYYSIPFSFQRSALRICSSLFLVSNGVFPTSFISIVFFSRNGLTFSRFFGLTRLSKKQLSFTSSLFLPFFPPVPFEISGRDPLVVVECCNAPRPMCQVSSSYSLLLPCLLLACRILPCHHPHCIFMFSKRASVRVSPVPSVVRSKPNHTRTHLRHVRNIL